MDIRSGALFPSGNELRRRRYQRRNLVQLRPVVSSASNALAAALR
jgi:hypothetical protein